MNKAAFLGRFQPLHKGHEKVIEQKREEFNDFVVVIGSAEKSRTEENPLTAEEREELISGCFPEIEVFRLEDDESDEVWLENLKQKVDPDVVISGNDLVQRLVSEDPELELEEQELHEQDIYSGTEIRRRIRSDHEWRYLVPKCAQEKLEELEEVIKKSGPQYEFEPGWKKENAFHGTADE